MENYLLSSKRTIEASIFSILILSFVGCSKHPTVEEAQHEAYHERAHSTTYLQSRYEHILKNRSMGRDISESRNDMKSDMRKTFKEIDSFKKDFSSLALARQRHFSKERRVGKNKLPSNEREVRVDYSEGCSRVGNSEELQGLTSKDLKRVNKELTRYY